MQPQKDVVLLLAVVAVDVAWWFVGYYAVVAHAVADCDSEVRDAGDCAAFCPGLHAVADCDRPFAPYCLSWACPELVEVAQPKTILNPGEGRRSVFVRAAGVVGAGLQREDWPVARSCPLQLPGSRA